MSFHAMSPESSRYGPLTRGLRRWSKFLEIIQGPNWSRGNHRRLHLKRQGQHRRALVLTGLPVGPLEYAGRHGAENG